MKTVKTVKTVFTTISKFLVTAVLVGGLSGCIVMDVKGAGVFKKPIEYDNRDVAYVDIPAGTHGQDLRYLDRKEKDGSKI